MAARGAVASALPQFAKGLLLANIEWGLDLKFMRATTTPDVLRLHEAFPIITKCYNIEEYLYLGVASQSDREAIALCLKDATDDGREIIITERGPSDMGPTGQKTGFHFGAHNATLPQQTETDKQQATQAATQPQGNAGMAIDGEEEGPEDEALIRLERKLDEEVGGIKATMVETDHKITKIGEDACDALTPKP